MALEDLHNAFLSFTNPAPDATPDIDSVMSAATEVYNADIEIRDAAVRAREEAIAEKDKEISVLKQKNYDLLVKSPATTVVNDSTKDDTVNDDDRAATITINDLFEGR